MDILNYLASTLSNEQLWTHIEDHRGDLQFIVSDHTFTVIIDPPSLLTLYSEDGHQLVEIRLDLSPEQQIHRLRLAQLQYLDGLAKKLLTTRVWASTK